MKKTMTAQALTTALARQEKRFNSPLSEVEKCYTRWAIGRVRARWEQQRSSNAADALRFNATTLLDGLRADLRRLGNLPQGTKRGTQIAMSEVEKFIASL